MPALFSLRPSFCLSRSFGCFSAARKIARQVIFAVFLMATCPLHAWSATLLESSRSVIVSAFVDASGVTTGEDLVGFETEASGVFLEAAVGGAGFGDIAVANGEATQDSTIDLIPGGGIALDAGGAAGVVFDVQDPGFPSRAQGLADSVVSMTFLVGQASPFVLSSSLIADLEELNVFSGAGPVNAEVVATLRLSGLVSGIIVEREVRDDAAGVNPVLDDFSLQGLLAPDTYLLEISAIADLGGFENASGFGTAGFGASLTIVPEPGTLTLFGLGLMGLAAFQRR